MFSDIESKLKVLAKVNFVCGIIIAIAFFVVGATLSTEASFLGFAVGVVYIIAQLILSWFIYAFAELLESTKETNRILKLGYADDITKEREKEEEIERVRIAQEEWERQKKAEAKRKEEEQKQAAEAARQARIVAYWDSHPEEKKALAEKRIAAEKKLNELGGLAVEQRKALEDLIRAIDEEFEKDREG